MVKGEAGGRELKRVEEGGRERETKVITRERKGTQNRRGSEGIRVL